MLPEPFLVIATENPKGSAGTQLLPESQLDRFMICMSMGYPDFDSEVLIAQGKSSREGLEQIRPVIDAGGLVELQREAEAVYVHESIYEYITTLVAATRENDYIELGVSPRGTIACVRMAKAWAYVHGRDYVLPEDVLDIFADVTLHRIVLNTKARVAKLAPEQVLGEIAKQTNPPSAFVPPDIHRRRNR